MSTHLELPMTRRLGICSRSHKVNMQIAESMNELPAASKTSVGLYETIPYSSAA